MSIPRIIIAGTHSGSGKTTVATGVIAAFAARLSVQPFKCGPDYIDPTYHSRAAGRPSRNLDTWMLPERAMLELFERAGRGAEIAVIEGVMGLFDGRTGEGDAGSTAHVAKLLGAPVVLVVDAAGVARSAAALVRGFDSFDPELRIAGVILNRIASERHYRAVAPPIEDRAGVPVLGYLPRDAELTLPERYLGLVPTVEGLVADAYFDRLHRACEGTIDLARLEAIAAAAPPLPHPNSPPAEAATDAERSLFPHEAVDRRATIAVARDAAFSFYYEDNLDLLRAWGADIVEFSPLESLSLPPDTAAVYLGGGFPELFAGELAANLPLRESIRSAADAGMPVYAECGGLMYAGESISDGDGGRHEMLGLVPARSSMRNARLSLGYRELRSLGPSPALDAGTSARAHEFHYSTLDAGPSPAEAAYVVDGEARIEGYRRGSVFASYMHLHFGSSPAIARRFVATAANWLRKE